MFIFHLNPAIKRCKLIGYLCNDYICFCQHTLNQYDNKYVSLFAQVKAHVNPL